MTPEARLRRIRRTATVLDGVWGIPGTRWRLGVDALLGLLPVAGDLVSALLGLSLVWHAHQLGAPKGLKLRMAGNIGMDFVLGSLPLVGDVADILVRKNQRNAELIERWVQESHDADAKKPLGGEGQARV